MTTDPIDRAQAAITKDEPIIVSHAALWLLSVVGEIIVGRTHLVTDHEWSGLQSMLIPLVTTLLLAGSAWVMRSLVSPAFAFAHRVEAEVVKRIGEIPTLVDPPVPADPPAAQPPDAAPEASPEPAAPVAPPQG